jgi:hypothetical protein
MFSVLGGVFEEFVPPEGDGKSSILSKAVGRITVISNYNRNTLLLLYKGSRGRDRIVFGFITTYVINAYPH